ncbi:MAG: ABC transporter ATP-binding protein [Spirochaetales bacterium]|nr:ABC transporter ATP-binding protein [Spirochaetales bacterium]
MSYLDVRNLSFSFDHTQPILRDVSFSIEKGSLTVLTGRNGSGKTVLLKCLKGLYPISAGSIAVEGNKYEKARKERNRRFALVFQEAESQIVGQTVYKDIEFGLENLEIPKSLRKETIDSTARLMRIKHLLGRRPQTLSGGELRRLAIAGVLAMAPQILMLDEPFANLDADGITDILQVLVHMKAQGHTILVVTHELEKILAHADRLVVMDRGTVVIEEAPSIAVCSVEQFGVHRPRCSCGYLPVEEMTWLT